MNIEQRKRVTIGVELAARPELLLFLDEPTSGLDSDTAWSICMLLRKLADGGQAILCTIHQPSGILFEMFDRLLFLSEGKSLYFGDIGCDSKVLTAYFEQHGARKCEAKENPAEWLLRVTNHVHGSEIVVDWAEKWRCSEERRQIKADLNQMKEHLAADERPTDSKTSSGEFATPFAEQLYLVTKRGFTNNWRTAAYLYSQFFLVLGLVSHCSRLFPSDLTLDSGHLQWVLFLPVSQQSPRNPEPIVFGVHSHDNLYQYCPSHYASVSLEPGSVRSSRTSVENIQLESVHFIKHHHRDSVANLYGLHSLSFLVLSSWYAS